MSFDLLEELAEPLEGQVGGPAQIELGPSIKARCRGWSMVAPVLEVLPTERFELVRGCSKDMCIVFDKEFVDEGFNVCHVAVVNRIPRLPDDPIDLVWVRCVWPSWLPWAQGGGWSDWSGGDVCCLMRRLTCLGGALHPRLSRITGSLHQ